MNSGNEAGQQAAEPMPELIRPMLAVTGELPRDQARWGFEFKWDGVRAVIYCDRGRLRILTRNDRDATVAYPELAGLGDALCDRQAILDGEIVAFEEDGRPSFGALQPRMHVNNAARAAQLVNEIPVIFLAFDLLYLDGSALLESTYQDRRQALESLALTGPSWRTPSSTQGDGQDVANAARQHRLEGVMAKRLDSRYQPGKRSHAWIKAKLFATQEVVIGGWRPGEGRRSGGIGSLMLGVNTQAGLTYVGQVGTGFTDRVLAELQRQLAELRTEQSPFVNPVPRPQAAGATWVRPVMVGEVAYGEWTRDGRLRHPAWRGLRNDKSPSEVVREL